MAIITDYTSLSQTIVDWAHRQDLQQGQYTDYFIQNAQLAIPKDIIRENYGNGIRAMEVAMPVATIDASLGTIPVPSDWYAPKDMQVVSSDGEFDLTFKAARWIYSNYPVRQAEGLPEYIARDKVVGSTDVFIFGPFPDSAYTVQGTYYSMGTALNDQNPTNWMVTTCPDLFHAACMIEAAKFLENAAMLQLWTPVYLDGIDKLINQDKGERFSGGTLAVELG